MPPKPHYDEKQLIKDLEESETLAFVNQFKQCLAKARNWRKLAMQTDSEDNFSNALIKNGCNPNLTEKIKDANLRKRAEICLLHYKNYKN